MMRGRPAQETVWEEVAPLDRIIDLTIRGDCENYSDIGWFEVSDRRARSKTSASMTAATDRADAPATPPPRRKVKKVSTLLREMHKTVIHGPRHVGTDVLSEGLQYLLNGL